jgi:hypothetical protein
MDSPVRTGGGLNAAVAAEVRAELARRRWSQVELAAKLGEDQMWLSRRLRGTKPLTITELEAIALALQLTPAELLARAVQAVGSLTQGYFALTDRPRDTRPSGGPGKGRVNGPPNGASPVRRSRVTGVPLAVANSPRVA